MTQVEESFPQDGDSILQNQGTFFQDHDRNKKLMYQDTMVKIKTKAKITMILD